LLEDSGYLPRLSILSDRVMRWMGLNGQGGASMVLGLGCGHNGRHGDPNPQLPSESGRSQFFF